MVWLSATRDGTEDPCGVYERASESVELLSFSTWASLSQSLFSVSVRRGQNLTQKNTLRTVHAAKMIWLLPCLSVI